MAQPMMFASAPTSDGHWFAVRVHASGTIADTIPGLFETKVACEQNAKRFVSTAK